MEKSQLWEAFILLSRRDLRELDKFVRSPAFNQREHVCRLFACLRDCRTENRLPEQATAFRAAFGNEPYDVLRLRNSMSLLLRVMEEYLILRDYRADSLRSNLHLSKTWRGLGLERQFEQTMKELDALQEKAEYRNAEFFHTQYLIEQERYYDQAGRKRMTGLNLQAVSENLDIFFLTQKLRQTCFALSHQAVFAAEYDLGILPEALAALETGKYGHVPAVRVYYFCYLALTRPDEEAHFQQFKTLLLENGGIFPPDERRDLFLLATNYCIRRLNAGARHYTREALELYREGLRDNVILLNGLISRFTYGNIVTMAIGERQLDWGEEFIHGYRDKLEEKHRDSSFSFHLARLEYERGRYDEALPLLQNAEYSDLILNLSAKTLAMKIYGEARQYDLLYSHLDAMQNFIRRHKELGYHRENYRNTIRFLQKILKINPLDKKAPAALAGEIRDTKAVAEREWLLGLLPA